MCLDKMFEYINLDNIHKYIFFGFVLLLLILYLPPLIRHYLINNKECSILKGTCPTGKYCNLDGKCVEGNENDTCFLGLAQCKRPFNCLPDFKCHKF
jgi:hypothetical protein